MLYFFDTSGLQYRYVDGVHSRGIRRIISDKRNRCYVSELTILEIASVLATRCRRDRLSLERFARMDRAFWEDVHQRRLQIRQLTKGAILRARHLLRRATELNRKMTSADAVIATAAMELAFEERAPVTFCLADWSLFDVIRSIDAYRATLRFKYIGTLKTGGSTK